MEHQTRRRTVFWAALAIVAALQGTVVAQVPEIINLTNPQPEIINITNPQQAAALALEKPGEGGSPLTIKLGRPDAPRPIAFDVPESVWNQLPAVVNDERSVKPRQLPATNVLGGVALIFEQVPLLPDAADDTVIRINTARPIAEELFRLETEAQFRARLVKETERWRDRVQIPEFPVSPAKPLQTGRGWPLALETAESGRLCFFRLGFAQPMSERYGRTLGPLQPFLSVGLFYGDLVTLPVRALVPPWTIEQCDDLSDLSSVPWRGR